MKKLLIFSLVTLSFLVTMNSCKKEEVPTPEPIINLLVDEEPQALVDSLGSNIFDNPITSEVTVSTEASILDYPLFLDNDPFTSVLVRRTDSLCVKGIEVTTAEKERLTKAWNAKIECQKANKLTIAKIHRGIEMWAKTQKENYYKNWYMVEKGKLDDSLKRGLLTQTQYKEKLVMLDKTWAGKMLYINGQVKEKIKLNTERAVSVGKIKDCEKIWLQSVMDILGKKRYQKWIECYKYKYKRK